MGRGLTLVVSPKITRVNRHWDEEREMGPSEYEHPALVALDLRVLFLVLLFGLLAGLWGRVFFLLVHNEPCPALLLVPLKSGEVGLLQFIICLRSG